MGKTEQLLAAHEAQLSTPLRSRGLNPYTQGIPLRISEAWVLIQLDLIDLEQGVLMVWQGESDCPNDEFHSEEGECLCWSGAYEAAHYTSMDDLEAEAPVEWWPNKEKS
jgi:hypothetical protein